MRQSFIAFILGLVGGCAAEGLMYNTFQFSNDTAKLTRETIEWNFVDTSKLNLFPDGKENREQRAAKRAFFEDLYGLLETRDFGVPLKIALYLKPITETSTQTQSLARQSLGMMYFENKTILPVLFEDSPAWATWHHVYTVGYDSTVLVQLTPTGSSSTAVRVFNEGDPYEDTGRWIVRNIPKDYTKKEERFKKQNYLKPFVNTQPKTVNQQQLERLFQEYIEAKNLTPNSRMTDLDIYAAFEKETGFAYPQELQVIAGVADGMDNFSNYYTFLSAKEVLTEWKNWKLIYEDWSLDELTSNNEADRDKTLGIYTVPYWVPFMHDGAGNFIAIDFAPNTNGHAGQIIAFGADAVTTRYIAKDMTEFLELLLEGVDVVNLGLE